MQLSGLRDSLRVKLSDALNYIGHTEYVDYKDPANPVTCKTLAKCKVEKDEQVDGNTALVVHVEYPKDDHTGVYVYAWNIQLKGGKYILRSAIYTKDSTPAMYWDIAELAAGKLVVDCVVANICHIIGANE
jgi:hypothetical protein